MVHPGFADHRSARQSAALASSTIFRQGTCGKRLGETELGVIAKGGHFRCPHSCRLQIRSVPLGAVVAFAVRLGLVIGNFVIL